MRGPVMVTSSPMQPRSRVLMAGRLAVPHFGVADEGRVDRIVLGVLAEEAVEMAGIALLVALDHHRQAERQ